MTLYSKIQAVLPAAVGALIALVVSLGNVRQADACPFCSAAMQTLAQEIAGADGAVIAELVEPMPAAASPQPGVNLADPGMAAAKFRIIEILRGEQKIGVAKQVDVVYFGEDKTGKRFLVTGIAAISPDKIDWTTPVPLSERAEGYVKNLLTLPEAGAERLAFFQDYLEDDDRLLAQDSYDEFARAPYTDIIALGSKMNREKLIEWINDPNVGPSGRRLYLTMLGICGQPEDVAMLEKFLKYDYQLMKPGIAAVIAQAGVTGSPLGMGLVDEMMHADERRKKESLDALIACYLKLKGPSGLELVNEKFLGNPTVEYKHLHSAIMALRFHGEETDILPREKLLESMRLALDHKEFADQVIPDLTRWEDWDVMPRLVAMFKDAPADDWIRQPVASFVLVAAEQPGEVGERARASLVELEGLDPETVERARSLSAFSFLAKAADPASAAASGAAAAASSPPAATNGSTGSADKPSDARVPAVKVSTASDANEADAAAEPDGQDAAKGGVNPTGGSLPPAVALPMPSRLKIIGVPLLAAVVLLAIFAVLLRGTDPRSSQESPNN